MQQGSSSWGKVAGFHDGALPDPSEIGLFPGFHSALSDAGCKRVRSLTHLQPFFLKSEPEHVASLFCEPLCDLLKAWDSGYHIGPMPTAPNESDPGINPSYS